MRRLAAKRVINALDSGSWCVSLSFPWWSAAGGLPKRKTTAIERCNSGGVQYDKRFLAKPRRFEVRSSKSLPAGNRFPAGKPDRRLNHESRFLMLCERDGNGRLLRSKHDARRLAHLPSMRACRFTPTTIRPMFDESNLGAHPASAANMKLLHSRGKWLYAQSNALKWPCRQSDG